MGRAAIGEEIGHGIYRDTGCEHAPSCLRCPFPVCIKYDNPKWDAESERRNAQITTLRSKGYTAKTIAETLNVPIRTVYNVFKRQEGLV